MSRSALKAVHAHFAVLTTSSKPTVAKSDAGDRAGVAGERALTLAGSRIPDLDHPILGPRNNTQCIRCQGPDTLQMAKERTQAPASASLP